MLWSSDSGLAKFIKVPDLYSAVNHIPTLWKLISLFFRIQLSFEGTKCFHLWIFFQNLQFVKEITLFRKLLGRSECKARREERGNPHTQDQLAGLHSYIIVFYSFPLDLTVKGHFTHNTSPTEFSVVNSIHKVWCKITDVLWPLQVAANSFFSTHRSGL